MKRKHAPLIITLSLTLLNTTPLKAEETPPAKPVPKTETLSLAPNPERKKESKLQITFHDNPFRVKYKFLSEIQKKMVLREAKVIKEEDATPEELEEARIRLKNQFDEKKALGQKRIEKFDTNKNGILEIEEINEAKKDIRAWNFETQEK